MKQLIALVVVMLLTIYLGIKMNVLRVDKIQLHKYIPVILKCLVKVLLTALISSLFK